MKTKKDILMDVMNISISYGDSWIIENLSTSIYAGSFIGLIGPNGAGKSTLLLSLSGQFKPKKGNISFEALDVYQQNFKFKQLIGYVHENPFFYPSLNVSEFLYFVGRVKKVPKNAIDLQISSALKAVCLIKEKQKITSKLSYGMQKKLALAAAILGDPKILFLDEALNGIDIESAFQIKKTLQDLVAKGKTVILSTHVMEVIEKICDRYIVLKSGKIIADLDAVESKEYTSSKEQDLEKFVIKLLQSK